MTLSTDRITSGECGGVCDTTTPRLTSNHNTHKGDSGMSLLLNGERVPKNHPACLLYGSIESAQQSIAECLYYNKLYSQAIEEVLTWLHRNLFSLSSFCFLKGDSTRHQLPDNFLEYLEKASKELGEEIGSAPDFLVVSHQSLLQINRIRIDIRHVESMYTSWHNSPELVRWQLDHPEVIPAIRKHAAILNRLSTFLFWVGRKQGVWLADSGFNLTESYWQAQAQPFTWD